MLFEFLFGDAKEVSRRQSRHRSFRCLDGLQDLNAEMLVAFHSVGLFTCSVDFAFHQNYHNESKLTCKVDVKVIYSTTDAIRAALAGRLGHEPIREIWDRLEEEFYFGFGEEWEEPADIDYLVEKYREFEGVAGQLFQPEENAVDTGPRQMRLAILAGLAARLAATEESVKAFRRQHLNDRLLTPEGVAQWISRQATEDGPASRFLRVPIPDGYEPVRRNGGIYTEPPLTISDGITAIQVEVELLSYMYPDDQWAHKIPVRHGGRLDELRVVSKALARRYTWQEAQATNFVLTGISPQLSSLRGGMRIVFNQPISSRITMEIDPTLTPEEVAERYKNLRARLIGARYRSMTEKHLRLAEFYGGQKPQGMTWAALMHEWNHSQGRRWEYKRFENFARDCKQAWSRLMGQDLLKYPDL